MDNNEGRTKVFPINELYWSNNEYRGLKLTNGMKVLLVRKPRIKNCEVLLNIRIGSYYDPSNIQGMAHLLEHVIARNMVCVSQSEFATILHEYGGHGNAATCAENTTYKFKAHRIKRLLKLFADFIFEPNLDLSIIENDVKAIDSEDVIKSTDDGWRLQEFQDAHWRMSDSTYPVYGIGNMYTLQRDTIETELREFHNQLYSANVMSLCVVARESLNSLQAMVEDFFCSKPNRNIEILPITSIANIFPQVVNDYKTAWYIIPTLPKKTLHICFPFLPNYVECQPEPANYICWMLNDRRQGSLLTALKNRNWCTFIDCFNEYKTIEHITGNIWLKLTLTEQGLDHIDDIITLIFQYLRLLPTAETRNGHYYVFGQNVFLQDLVNFEDIVIKMSLCPLPSILEHCYVRYTEFPQDKVDEILGNYVVPEYIIYCAMAKKYKNITNEITRWRQTKYIRHNIQNDQILHWKFANIIENINRNEGNEELKLLQNNIFEWNLIGHIRNNITSEKDDKPKKIYRKNFLRIWSSVARKHQNFEMYFQFYSTCSVDKDEKMNNCRNCNLNSMFVNFIQDYMSDFLYSAEMVGIIINFKSNIYGISLYIKNHVYKKELPEMIKNIIRNMIDISINESRFEMLKEEYITSLKANNKYATPHKQAQHLLEILLTKRLPYHELLEDAMCKCNYEGSIKNNASY